MIKVTKNLKVRMVKKIMEKKFSNLTEKDFGSFKFVPKAIISTEPLPTKKTVEKTDTNAVIFSIGEKRTESGIAASLEITGRKTAFFTITDKAIRHIYRDHKNNVLKSSFDDKTDMNDLSCFLMSCSLTIFSSTAARKLLYDLNEGDSVSITIPVPCEYRGYDIFGEEIRYWTLCFKAQGNGIHNYSISSAFPRPYMAKCFRISAENRKYF